ncbi:hypothetical protein J7E93_09600 [Streptomyces sp. ISL-36]|uniref:hypothetical protein n=1 Tax=Streptomyces sp. ISL-36 TaxID=2819182 RepID=UPI001BE9CB82|nr:hypothetical protein [Streptomyces sp. ISL-36]MBT2440358.1 hypothetical protein [Streptomyces sp. ISL-36]
MTRTTPERPVDIEALFPALAAYRRTSTRLHPRMGSPKAEESSVAGPFLWPADEPWPMCTAVHPKGTGHLLSDVRLERRILAEGRGREFSEEERRILDGIRPGLHAPELRDEDPIPMLAVAQLYARDIPDLVGPPGYDLLQVFWCPFEVHGPERTIDVVLKWRRADEVGPILAEQPEPKVVGREECVPNVCVLHPEQVVEHEYEGLLSEELQEALAAWEESLLEDDEDAYDSSEPPSYDTYEEYQAAMAAAQAEEEYEVDYRGDLSIPPGWKVGGFASWHLTDPAPVDCPACGTPMPPLLTVAHGEWDGGSESWIPLEDREPTTPPMTGRQTGVYLGRGLMRIHTCPADPLHPHRLSFQ